EFSKTTKRQVAADSDAIRGLQGNTVSGRMSARDGLLMLVSDTGLTVINQQGNFAIREGNDSPLSGVGASALLEQVVVTGSRIQRSEFEGLLPSIVVDVEQMQVRGVANVADALNEQPGFTDSSTPLFGGRQNQVNFLGLGTGRTLTLVNGKRFVPSAGVRGLAVDLNNIPLPLIERVETVAVGGAPIYGTDAIAGTVNILLNDDYEGIELYGQAGVAADEGDAFRSRTGVVFGKNLFDGRANVTFSLEYNTQDNLVFNDRPDTSGRVYSFQAPDPGANSPFNQVLVEDTRTAIISTTGNPVLIPGVPVTFGADIPLDPGNPDSPLAQFNAVGDLVPYDPGSGTGSPVFRSGGDGADFSALRSLLSESERTQATLLARYDLSDNVRLKFEGWINRADVDEPADEGLYQSALLGAGTFTDVGAGPVPVLLDNPFVTSGTRDIVSRALDVDGDGNPDANIDTDGDGNPDAPGFFVDRTFTLAGGVTPVTSDNELLRAVLGLEGEFNLANQELSWEVAYVYGESESTDSQPVLRASRVTQAVNVVVDPSTGEPACADPSNGCVPFNVMIANPDLSFVLGNIGGTTRNEQQVFMANITGGLFDLPTGKVEFSAGVDFRTEEASRVANALSASNDVPFPQIPETSGEFDSTEVYGELVVPLIGNQFKPLGIQSFDFEGAFRWVDNSIGGTDVTWTLGARAEPFPGLQLRGNRTEAIRAPTIDELFRPRNESNTRAQDPCDSRFIGLGNFPERRAANCAADGIVQPFQSIGSDASIIPTLSGGNPDLENETAESWTIGAIVQPEFIPGLSISLDWIDIEISDAVESLNGAAILETCYDSASFPGGATCSNFTRGPDGQLTFLQTGVVNVAGVEFSGLTAGGRYLLPTERFGSFDFSLSYFYTDEYTEIPATQQPRERVGELNFPEDRVTAAVGWQSGRFSVNNQVRWVSSVVFDSRDNPNARDVSEIDSFWTLNTSISYDVTDTISLQLNIDNVFDEQAPRPIPLAFDVIEGVSYTSGLIGRYATLTARASF
ncbi:MAG: TonB-dependent receptor, partial [Pseudomonadota bacterium]